MLQNISISNPVLFNFLFIKESGKKTVFNIENNHKCFLSIAHIRVISEGSCDTED